MIGFNERLRPIAIRDIDHLFLSGFGRKKKRSVFSVFFFSNKKLIPRKERLRTSNINTVVVSGSPNRYVSGIYIYKYANWVIICHLPPIGGTRNNH